MGKPVGHEIDVVKIRGDAKVPEEYAPDLMKLVARLNGDKN